MSLGMIVISQVLGLERFFMDKILDITLPIKTVSEANCSEHWTKKHKRHKLQKKHVKLAFLVYKPKITLPCLIRLIRISPRSLDSKDNLPMAFKYIADSVADYIHPGLQAGRADDDENIKWDFGQEKGSPQSIRIEVYS